MPGVRTIRAALSAVRFVAALLACSAAVWAQPTFPGVPPGVQPEALPAPLGTQPSPGPLPPGAQVPGGAPGAPEDVTAKEQKVADVRVEGRQSVQMAKIQPYIRVRPGRAFNLEMIEADVRSLLATRLFVDVKPLYQQTPDGVVVIYRVVERPIITDLIFVGNQAIKDRTLKKESGLKVGDAVDPSAIAEARTRIEEYYHRKGFNFAQIAVLEGNTPGDRRAVLQIHEGPRQRIEHVDFIGNTIVSDERLRTLLKSKAIYGWRVGASFWPYKFGGDFTPEKIDEDLERLSSYYHGLGFWSVRIGREVEYDEDGDSILVTFVIDEGPQFKVRDLTIVGNQKHSTEELVGLMKLKVGEYFNQEKLQADVNNIKNLYGGEGHIHADIQPDVRFLEEPGLLDIVYQIDEGARFRVGKINVVINGDYPHTKITTVLNRVSLHPGDVLDINELRASERRLKGSGLFRNDPAKGTAPKIVFGPPKINGPGGGRTQLAEGPNGSARGQSPETGDGWHYDQRGGVWTTPAASQPQPGDRLIDVTMLDGEILPPVLQDTPTSELRYDVPPGEQAPPVDAPVANPYPGPAFAPPTGYAPRPASSGPIPLGAPGYGHPYPAQAPYPTAPGNPPPHPHPSYGPRPTATQPTGGDSGANAPAAGPTRQMGYRRPLDEANGSPVALSANHSRSVENLDSDDDRPLLHGAGEMLGVRSGQFDDFALASAAFGRHDRQAVLSPGVLNWADVNDPYDLTARDRAIAARPIPAGKVVRGQDGGRAIPNAPWGDGDWRPATPAAAPVYGQPVYDPYNRRTTPIQLGQSPDSGGYYAPPANSQPLPAPQYDPYTSPPVNAQYNPNAPVTPGGAGYQPSAEDPDGNGPLLPPYGQDDWVLEPTQDIDVVVEETETGKIMFGLGVNSDAGVIGNIVLDEQNFDWRRLPRSFNDVVSGGAFRGGGQRFRIEAAPGTQVSRYLASFQNPYVLDTRNSFGISGSYYQRGFFDYSEDRTSARVSLGRSITPDLSATVAVRAENVNIYNPRVSGVPALDEALGHNMLYGFRGSLIHDTRDSPFLATEGHYIDMHFEQVIGDFVYPRGGVELRQYFLVGQRADGSGRHTISFVSQLDVTGPDTPIYENYFGGGYSSIRGFAFRGASPTEDTVRTGGEFLWLNSLEYMFPITANDMLRGVLFVDTGTVEEQVELKNYRVSPGFGLRVNLAALGPAPIALDFAFPVSSAPNDDEQVFSFFMSANR